MDKRVQHESCNMLQITVTIASALPPNNELATRRLQMVGRASKSSNTQWQDRNGRAGDENDDTANLRTTILDFRGFDSSRISILRGGIPMSIGHFPESLSQ